MYHYNPIIEDFISPLKGVGIVVLCNEQILLAKRVDSGEWSLPGGKIENGENALDAAKRELFEEVGIETSSLSYIGISYAPANPFKNDSIDGVGIDFLYECDHRPKIFLQKEEMSSFQWISLREALSLFNLYPATRRTLELLINIPVIYI